MTMTLYSSHPPNNRTARVTGGLNLPIAISAPRKMTVKSDAVRPVDCDNLQNCCLRLMRQMASVVDNAETMFSDFSADLDTIMTRSSKLGGRVAQIASFVARLDSKKSKGDRTCPPLPPPSLDQKQLTKEDISGPYNLFTPDTRPHEVIKLYKEAGGRKPVQTGDFACQTDSDALTSDFSRKTDTLKTEPDVSVKRKTNISSENPDVIYETVPVMVSIDTSKSTFKRMSSQRRSSQFPQQSRPACRENSFSTTERRISRPRDVDAASHTSANISDISSQADTSRTSSKPPRKRRPRGARRNTIAGPIEYPAQNIAELEKEKQTIFDDQILARNMPKSTSVDGFKRIPKDLSQTFVSTMKHQFASLKRKSRRKAKPDDPLYENIYEVSIGHSAEKSYESRPSYTTNPEESDYSVYNGSNSVSHSSRSTPTEPIAENTGTKTGTAIKHMLRRTLSLKLPKRAPPPPKRDTLDDLYSSVSFRQKPIPAVPEKPPPIPPKKRSAIPLTSQSQVIQMAAKIHRQTRPESQVKLTKMISVPGPYSSLRRKKPAVKTTSAQSLDSNWSINGFDQDSQSSYREGFRMEYPSECKASPMLSNRMEFRAFSESPNMSQKRPLKHPDFISYPRYGISCESEASVGEDSNFSCDFDGYYTSMHKDSGLWNSNDIDSLINKSLKRLQKGIAEDLVIQEHCDSAFSHLSNSTIESSSSNEALVDVGLSLDANENLDLVPLPKRMIFPNPDAAFPPICDISGHESDDARTLNGDESIREVTIPSPLPTFSPRWGPSEGNFPTFTNSTATIPKAERLPTTQGRKPTAPVNIALPPPKMTSSPKRNPEMTPPVAKVRPHQHNGKLITVGNKHIPEEVFDDWLLAKFQQEHEDERIPEARSLTPPSDTRSRDLNGNCSFEAYKAVNSQTMPRKTVRFCD